MRQTFYMRRGKRLFDLTAATLLLLVTAPLIALVALAVRFKLGSPVLFCQERPGWRAETFRMFKFRTMTDTQARDGSLRPDAERLTRFGRFLRSTSLDELPELINIIRGEMSLVGPRPLLMEYLELYDDEQMRRHEVLPGLTGWAQVNGRNAAAWRDRFRMDVWYVDHLSFALDVRILWLTLFKALLRLDIQQPGHATAERFRGDRDESS